ncbi:MAG: N,N-diacetylchitobiose transport system substrate-binding protein [Frankiaceae bacterium]|nr:N,N-diacetylchitobiose transport system substrate-binding protein [Frankiaceae bacterium]
MKTRHVSVVAVAAALALAGCSNSSTSTTNSPAASNPQTSTGTSGSPSASAAGCTDTATLNVTLMKDSINAATQQAAVDEMKKVCPNVTVNVQILTWDVRAAKWTAAWSATPATIDAAEMGNTDVLSWATQGAIAELQPTSFENSDQWLDSLKAAGTVDGKLYGVPYYAGARVLWYNKKMVGSATAPTTLDDLQKLAAGLKTSTVSGIYMPGRNWYVNTSFLVDAGMTELATKTGSTWKVNINSPEAVKGLDRLKAFVGAVSNAPATVDELNDAPVFGQKKTAMLIEPGWWNGVITDTKKGGQAFPAADLGAWTLPGTNGPLPQFLGGSNLVVAANSAHKDLATLWTKVLSGTVVQTLIAKSGAIPNVKTLVDQVPEGPGKMAAAAATGKGWFTPTSVNWSKVETDNIMKDFYQKILTSGSNTQAVADEYAKKIETILNAAS